MEGVRTIQGFAALDREARERAERSARELRASILAVAPEATFTETHDETVVECLAEHREAVRALFVLHAVSWSKDPQPALDAEGEPIPW